VLAEAAPDQAGRDDHAAADPTPDLRLLRTATAICQAAAARGERLSQRALARQLRDQGHRFPNEQLRLIASSIGLTQRTAA
jgi:hypothetical protein